jgi:hypothetical protein
MKKLVLTFGTLAGVIIFVYSMIVFTVIGDFSKITPNQLALASWLGYIRYLVLVLGIIMAMIAYRKSVAGTIEYSRVFLVGMLVAVVTAVFVGLMEFSYLTFVNPDFIEQYMKVTMEAMRQDGKTQAEMNKTLAQMESFGWMRNPILTGLFYFVETSIVGTILSLIAAIFTRRTEAVDTSNTSAGAVSRVA